VGLASAGTGDEQFAIAPLRERRPAVVVTRLYRDGFDLFDVGGGGT